jgi:hypothetical protein
VEQRTRHAEVRFQWNWLKTSFPMTTCISRKATAGAARASGSIGKRRYLKNHSLSENRLVTSLEHAGVLGNKIMLNANCKLEALALHVRNVEGTFSMWCNRNRGVPKETIQCAGSYS